MSNTTIKLLYRHFCKSIPKQLYSINSTANGIKDNLYKRVILEEIEKFNMNANTQENKERLTKKYNNMIINFIEMRKNIKKEQFLLNYYGINQHQDQMEKIQQVARYCGLSITDTKRQLRI